MAKVLTKLGSRLSKRFDQLRALEMLVAMFNALERSEKLLTKAVITEQIL